jgi:Ca2+-binding EF-hand superfamily protein
MKYNFTANIANDLFNTLDSDGSLTIDRDEFVRFGMLIEEAKELFNRFDTDNSGTIEIEVFIHLFFN